MNREGRFAGEIKMVGMTGFEPATSASRTLRSSQAELHPDVNFALYAICGCLSIKKVNQIIFFVFLYEKVLRIIIDN